MNAVALAVLLLSVVPQVEPACEQVDLMEVNHFYDEQGRLVFDQVIFYDWSADHSRYMVRAWRLIKNPAQLPQRDWFSGGWRSVWRDGEVLRNVRSLSQRETFTQYDPELVEREHLPKERRRELILIKIDKPSGAIRPEIGQ